MADFPTPVDRMNFAHYLERAKNGMTLPLTDGDALNRWVLMVRVVLAHIDEAELERMLGCWVSELEPCSLMRAAWKDGEGSPFELIGLGWVGEPGKIVIPVSAAYLEQRRKAYLVCMIA